MNIFESDFIKLIQALNDREVKYIVVGGLCINFHGYKRNTGDIDLWIKDSLGNRQALVQVFEDLEFGRFDALLEIPMLPGFCEILLDNGIYVDLMDHIHGYRSEDFDHSFREAVIGNFDGVLIPFLHINQLLYSKRQSNRPKDQIDVLALERIVK